VSLKDKYYQEFREANCCILIPTFNNGGSLKNVIDGVLEYTDQLIVIDDGSTDSTAEILESFNGLHIIRFARNKGKGYAIRRGFEKASLLEFQYAITIDSDGQHLPENLPVFLEKLKEEKNAIIIGSRNMQQENVPGGSSFGNKFSNFWFWVETGRKLPDTQSGFRLYPVQSMQRISFLTSRFEFEVEVLVRAAWQGVKTIPVPIDVYYPEKEKRITHFRPFTDFFRISLLNTVLTLVALIYIKPFQLLRNLSWENIKAFFKKELLNPKESNFKKAASVSLGLFMGIIPLWGWQTILALSSAFLLRLNKIITLVAANISIPPMLPFILYGSYVTGGIILGNGYHIDYEGITFEFAKQNLYQYIIGAFVFATAFGITGGIITYLLLLIFRKKPKVEESEQEYSNQV